MLNVKQMKEARGKIIGLTLVGQLPMIKNERGVRVPDFPTIAQTLGVSPQLAEEAYQWANGRWPVKIG